MVSEMLWPDRPITEWSAFFRDQNFRYPIDTTSGAVSGGPFSELRHRLKVVEWRPDDRVTEVTEAWSPRSGRRVTDVTAQPGQLYERLTD